MNYQCMALEIGMTSKHNNWINELIKTNKKLNIESKSHEKKLKSHIKKYNIPENSYVGTSDAIYGSTC